MFATLVGLRIDDDGLIRTLHSFHHLIQIGLICILPPVGLAGLATHKHCASTPPVGLVGLATFAIGAFATV